MKPPAQHRSLRPAPARGLATALILSAALTMALGTVAEREGSAATSPKPLNADNIQDVAAFDSSGNLFNHEPGELAVCLPGVAGIVGAEGIVTRRSIYCDIARVFTELNRQCLYQAQRRSLLTYI